VAHCILPPHILRSIAENGTPEQRSLALRTLSVDNTLRFTRTAPAAGAAGLPTPEGQKRRTVCTGRSTESLPGTVVRAEGQAAAGDDAADEAYDGLGATYDFYWDVFTRHSVDDEGLPLRATVHFGHAHDDAFWTGEQMVFGDGDGDLFRRFTVCLDVIGHELTHAVTAAETRLQYWMQAGALNESIADVFGSLVKQWCLRQAASEADWLIGAGLFTPRVQGRALRSLAAPGSAYDDPVLGRDPQPAQMTHFVHTLEDNGGVHVNSGIPNRAFHLVATCLGGNAWERAGRIWYETLRDARLRPSAGFRSFARLTAANASRLYGPNSDEERVVREAWRQVGVLAAQD
jgi:Zn-dependent metalloprotease